MNLSPTITPFLWFDDNAEEAAAFYVSIFPNSKILSAARRPENVPGPQGAVLIVFFELDGVQFTAMNGGPGQTFDEAISFVVACDTQREIDHYWDRLTADGGAPIQCGWLKDKFGLRWQIVPARLPAYFADTATSARVMAQVMQMVKLDIAKMDAAAAGNQKAS